MRGRITLRRPERVKLEGLDTRPLFEPPPGYNIAPTQKLWAVTEKNEGRSLSALQWGLIPTWSEKPTGFINARAETLESKPSFRECFLQRRCLIPADGFNEWEQVKESKAISLLPDEGWRAIFLRGTLGRMATQWNFRQVMRNCHNDSQQAISHDT